jgi:uncharacterized protein YegL
MLPLPIVENYLVRNCVVCNDFITLMLKIRRLDMTLDGQGSLSRRKLKIFMLFDTSSSMKGNRIESINAAMPGTLQMLKDSSLKNPQADISIRFCEFNTETRWLGDAKLAKEYGEAWTWSDITTSGITSTGAALELVTEELDPQKMGPYNYPPVIILLSDGAPTDDWESSLAKLNATPYGRKKSRTVRAALAVSGADHEMLSEFTGNSELVLETTTAEQMRRFLVYSTVTLSKDSSQGSTEVDESGEEVVMVTPPPIVGVNPDDDVF